MSTNLINYTSNITYRCTRCPWRGKFHEAQHSRIHGPTCPRCRAEIAEIVDATNDDIADALFTLLSACAVGHIRWPEHTRGHNEALRALKQARHALLRTRYRVQAEELKDPGPWVPESEATP